MNQVTSPTCATKDPRTTRQRLLRPLVAALALGLTVSLGSPAAADDLKDRRDQVRKAIVTSRQGVSESKAEMSKALAALAKAQSALAKAQRALSAATNAVGAARAADAAIGARLAVARTKLEQAKQAVTRAKAAVAAQLSLMGQAARESYQQQTDLVGLSVVFDSADTGDLSRRLQWSTTIFDATTAQMTRLRDLQAKLVAAQKAQAAYSLIMQDTVLAQGDVGRTMDSASNKTVASQKRFEELKTEIGTKLLPIYVGAMDAMNKAAGEVKKWWDENGENLKKKFTDIFGTDPVDNFKRGLKEVGVIFDDLKGRVSLAHAQFELGAVGIYKSIGPAWEGLGKLLLWLKNSVLDPLWGSVQNGIAGTVSAFGTLKSVIDPIVGTIQDMNRKLDELSRNPLIGAFVSGIRSLNPLMNMGDNTPFQGGKATGGILPDGMSWVGEHGRELAVTQGGQSRIIPNQNTGAALGGSRTVIVETPTLLYLDGNVVARSQRRRELQIR